MNKSKEVNVIKWIETWEIFLSEVMEAIFDRIEKITFKEAFNLKNNKDIQKLIDIQYYDVKKVNRIQEISEYYRVLNEIWKNINWPIIIELEWKKYFKDNGFLYEVQEQIWDVYIVYEALIKKHSVVSFDKEIFNNYLFENIDIVKKTDIDNWWEVKENDNIWWYIYVSNDWKVKYLKEEGLFWKLKKHGNIVYFASQLDMDKSYLRIFDWNEEISLEYWAQEQVTTLNNWKNILLIIGAKQEITIFDADNFKILIENIFSITKNFRNNTLDYCSEQGYKIKTLDLK
jgi:hypothetical protein